MKRTPKKRKKVKLRLVFRAIEYHTIEREMAREEFDRLPPDITAALDDKYRDADMSDSDIETAAWELTEWNIIK